MKSVDTPQHLIETYLSLLKNLSNDNKLVLISALSLSMTKEQKKSELIKTSFGAFKSDKSAEQLIEEVRQSRYFNKEVEKF